MHWKPEQRRVLAAHIVQGQFHAYPTVRESTKKIGFLLCFLMLWTVVPGIYILSTVSWQCSHGTSLNFCLFVWNVLHCLKVLFQICSQHCWKACAANIKRSDCVPPLLLRPGSFCWFPSLLNGGEHICQEYACLPVWYVLQSLKWAFFSFFVDTQCWRTSNRGMGRWDFWIRKGRQLQCTCGLDNENGTTLSTRCGL